MPLCVDYMYACGVYHRSRCRTNRTGAAKKCVGGKIKACVNRFHLISHQNVIQMLCNSSKRNALPSTIIHNSNLIQLNASKSADEAANVVRDSHFAHFHSRFFTLVLSMETFVVLSSFQVFDVLFFSISAPMQSKAEAKKNANQIYSMQLKWLSGTVQAL